MSIEKYDSGSEFWDTLELMGQLAPIIQTIALIDNAKRQQEIEREIELEKISAESKIELAKISIVEKISATALDYRQQERDKLRDHWADMAKYAKKTKNKELLLLANKNLDYLTNSNVVTELKQSIGEKFKALIGH